MEENRLVTNLKEIEEKVKVNNQKKQFEFGNLKGYVVKISKRYDINKKDIKYLVHIVCEDTKAQKIYMNLKQKEFFKENEADLYYDELNSLICGKYLESIIEN